MIKLFSKQKFSTLTKDSKIEHSRNFEVKPKFHRTRINVMGYPLLLENDNFRKKFAIRLFKTLKVLKNTNKISKYQSKKKFWMIYLFISIEMYNLVNCVGNNVKVFSNTQIKNTNIIKPTYTSETTLNKIPSHLINILFLYKFGTPFILNFPKLTYMYGIISLPFQTISDSFYLDKLKLYRMAIEKEEKQNPFVLLILSTAFIKFLNNFLIDKQKSNTLGFKRTNIKILFLNSKHILISLNILLLCRFTQFLDILGCHSFNLITNEGLICLIVAILVTRITLIIPLGIIWLYNPYSLYIYFSAKNSINEENLDFYHKRKSYYQRINTFIRFSFYNMYFQINNIYF